MKLLAVHPSCLMYSKIYLRLEPLVLRGQTNFVRMLWKFNSVYNPKLQLADHQQPVKYEISPPPDWEERIARGALYVHARAGAKAARLIRQQRNSSKRHAWAEDKALSILLLRSIGE